MKSKDFYPGMSKGVWGKMRTLSGIWISWRACLKRLSAAPSSNCKCWTLTLRSGTLEPLIHRCVVRTKVMANLLLTDLQILKYGCRHFVASRLDILFRVDVASTPMILSTEAKKGENC